MPDSQESLDQLVDAANVRDRMQLREGETTAERPPSTLEALKPEADAPDQPAARGRKARSPLDLSDEDLAAHRARTARKKAGAASSAWTEVANMDGAAEDPQAGKARGPSSMEGVETQGSRRNPGGADEPQKDAAESTPTGSDGRVPLRTRLSPDRARIPGGGGGGNLPLSDDAGNRLGQSGQRRGDARDVTDGPGAAPAVTEGRMVFRGGLPTLSGVATGLDGILDVVASPPRDRRPAPAAPEEDEEEPPVTGREPVRPERLEVAGELPEGATCPACGGPLRWIREQAEVRLDLVDLAPQHLVVRRDVMDCRACPKRAPQVAPTPAYLAPDLLGNGMLAQVVVARWADDLALQFQADLLHKLDRGVSQPRLAALLRHVGRAILPLHAFLLDQVQHARSEADKDPIPAVSMEKRPRVGTVRALRGADAVAFQFQQAAAPGRGEAGPERGDPAGGLARQVWNRTLGRSRDARWAVVRQHFFQALPGTPTEARQGLRLLQRIWCLDRPGGDPAAATEAREAFRAFCELHRGAFERPVNPFQLGVFQALTLWPGLQPDAPEPTARPGLRVSLEEKGFRQVFEEWEGGAEVGVAFLTLVESCRALGVWPGDYLTALFGAVALPGEVEWARWTPKAWLDARDGATAT